MQNIGYLFIFLGRLILFPLYFLAGFFPRKADYWVFGSWGGYRFADNAAAFFLYCQKEIGDRVKLVWITRDRSIVKRLRGSGYAAYWIWSPGGIIACLRAGFYFFDGFLKDSNFWLSRGSIKINLWSGVPLKVFERDIDTPDSRYYRLFHGSLIERWLYGMMMPWHVVKPDLIIATSAETATITQRAFALQSECVSVTGFPRNDIMMEGAQSISGSNISLPRTFLDAVAAGGSVYLYLPTYRDSGKEYMDIDWEQLDACMARIGAKLFVKTHPDDRSKIVVHCDHIVQLPQATDIYDFLPHISALISDYSSIVFDFMLLNRPIIYYTPDLEEFLGSSRSLLFHPSEIAVGPMCSTFQELMKSLEDLATHGAESYAAQREEILPRLHTYLDARSNERVLELIDQRFFNGALRNP
jgi:CDP-glycerol glycerophosphotransferase (TagB/SpsB family)